MTANWARCIAVLLVVSAAGCATAPPGSPNLRSAEFGLGVVALSAPESVPAVNLSAATPAASRAGAYFGDCAGSNELGIILSPICAIIGLFHGASLTAPRATREDAEQTLRAQIAEMALQQRLLRYASEYAKASGLTGVTVVPAETRIAREALPRYSARDLSNVDTILEMTLTEFAARTTGERELLYQFSLTARGRLIRLQDNKVLEIFERCLSTRPRTYNEWEAEDAKLFKEELAQVARALVEGFIDEWILVYHGSPPAPDIERETPEDAAGNGLFTENEIGTVPRHVLRPLYPKEKYSNHGFIAPSFVNLRRIIASNDLKPTFQWESLPQSLAALGGTGSDQVSSIVYDFRLYETSFYQSLPFFGIAKPEFWVPGLLVVSSNGLTTTQFTPDAPLKPCARYHWTVRARFSLNGSPRATEWGWMPDTLKRQGLVNPRYRGTSCRMQGIYFPIITPNGDGTKCK